MEEQKPDLWRPHENEDFGLLLNRIEIIKSDFDVVAQVCGRLSPGSVWLQCLTFVIAETREADWWISCLGGGGREEGAEGLYFTSKQDY